MMTSVATTDRSATMTKWLDNTTIDARKLLVQSELRLQDTSVLIYNWTRGTALHASCAIHSRTRPMASLSLPFQHCPPPSPWFPFPLPKHCNEKSNHRNYLKHCRIIKNAVKIFSRRPILGVRIWFDGIFKTYFLLSVHDLDLLIICLLLKRQKFCPR